MADKDVQSLGMLKKSLFCSTLLQRLQQKLKSIQVMDRRLKRVKSPYDWDLISLK